MTKAITLRPLRPFLVSVGLQDIEGRSHAKKAKAPVKPNTSVSLGKTTVRIAAQNRLVATDKLMPTSVSRISFLSKISCI